MRFWGKKSDLRDVNSQLWEKNSDLWDKNSQLPFFIFIQWQKWASILWKPISTRENLFSFFPFTILTFLFKLSLHLVILLYVFTTEKNVITTFCLTILTYFSRNDEFISNDTKMRQTETLKRDFRSLIETVHSTSPVTTTIVSGSLPTYRRGHERFSRLFALNEWLLSWCKEQKLLFVNNWNLFWERPRLFRADGLHPSRVGAELLSDNISRTLRSIWLVSKFSNNCYDDFCSTHLNDRSTCIVQSIQTVSVPWIVRSTYKFNAGSRKQSDRD